MTSTRPLSGRPWLYVVLVFVFFACVWAGWRDFDPRVPQEEVREGIRSTIRTVIQILVQFIVPGAIVVFFGKETLARFRGKRDSRGRA